MRGQTSTPTMKTAGSSWPCSGTPSSGTTGIAMPTASWASTYAEKVYKIPSAIAQRGVALVDYFEGWGSYVQSVKQQITNEKK